MIDLGGCEPMAGDGCRAEPLAEHHREPLRAACAEDREIWAIYATTSAPTASTTASTLVANPSQPHFVLFDGDELAGMSSFLGIDEGRGAVEIGGTYYRPSSAAPASTAGQGHDARRAFACGFRRVEFRVDLRNCAARRRWPNWVRSAKACCAPTASPGPAMSAIPPLLDPQGRVAGME